MAWIWTPRGTFTIVTVIIATMFLTRTRNSQCTSDGGSSDPVFLIPESKGDLMAAVKLLAGSTVEIAAASVGDRSLVNAVRTTEKESKGSSSLLEVREIQQKLGEVMGNEDGDEEAAAANKKKSEEEQEAAPPPEETATAAITTDAEPQVTGGAPDTDPSSDISPLDPAPAEKTMSDESAPPSEEPTTTLEATTPEEAALAEETTVTAPERSVEEGEDVSSAETSAEPEVLPAEDPKCTSEPPETTPLCHSVEEMVAQADEALSEGATDETKSDESHSKSIHPIIYTLAVINGRLWL